MKAGVLSPVGQDAGRAKGIPVMSPLIEAAKWVEALLLGQVGTVVAILAVAWTGALMLQGRLALLTGLRVVMGCFILFGAPVIAKVSPA